MGAGRGSQQASHRRPTHLVDAVSGAAEPPDAKAHDESWLPAQADSHAAAHPWPPARPRSPPPLAGQGGALPSHHRLHVTPSALASPLLTTPRPAPRALRLPPASAESASAPASAAATPGSRPGPAASAPASAVRHLLGAYDSRPVAPAAALASAARHLMGAIQEELGQSRSGSSGSGGGSGGGGGGGGGSSGGSLADGSVGRGGERAAAAAAPAAPRAHRLTGRAMQGLLRGLPASVAAYAPPISPSGRWPEFRT